MSNKNFTAPQSSLIDLAKEISKKLGTTSISLLEFRDHTNVSDYTIAREFGGWTELCKCAGLDIPNRYAECSDDDLLDEMRRVFETAGKQVNIARFDALSKFSSKMYRRRFGSWTEALSRLGAQSKTATPPQPISSVDGPNALSDVFLAAGSSPITITPGLAQNIFRVAIDLLRLHPKLFQTELTEFRNLVMEIEQTTDSKNIISATNQSVKTSAPHEQTSPLAKVTCWLANRNSVSTSEFRDWLAPLDLLPSAAIDAINEHALDICGEIAVEETESEVLVSHKVINQVHRTLETESALEKTPLRPIETPAD